MGLRGQEAQNMVTFLHDTTADPRWSALATRVNITVHAQPSLCDFLFRIPKAHSNHVHLDFCARVLSLPVQYSRCMATCHCLLGG